MSRVHSLPLLWLLLVAGCAWSGDGGTAAVDAAMRSGRGDAAAPAEAAAPTGHDPSQGPADAVAAPTGATMAAPAFEFWRSPDFQRRFAESLLAESDYEPRVTASERDTMVAASELLAGQGDTAALQDQAIRLLQGRIGRSSGAALHFMVGTLLFQRERLAEAAAAYEQAVALHATFRRAWKNLALVQTRLGNHEAALQALTRTVQLGGADALTYGLLGFAHANGDDHVAAESAYRMAAMLDPSTADYRLGLARSYFKQRRYADAAALCGAMIARYPERADLWLLQANAFVGMNDTRKAVENLEMVDRLGQASADSLNLLGDIYVNSDLPELATSAWLRAMAKEPQGRPDRALRAAKALAARSAHAECKRLVDGIERTFGARLDDAGRKDLLKLRARLAVAAGAGEEEAQVLEQIVQLDPLDGDALILLGQYHQRRGEVERAVLQFERAAAISAFEADAKVRHAHLLVGLGRYSEALPLLRRAQQVKPRDNIQQFLEQVERVAGKQ